MTIAHARDYIGKRLASISDSEVATLKGITTLAGIMEYINKRIPPFTSQHAQEVIAEFNKP